MINNTFINNSAFNGSGGSMYLSCSITNNKGKNNIKSKVIVCQVQMTNNTFENNTASVYGGAVYYDLYSPVGLLNSSY